MKQPASYSNRTVWIHWLSALLIFGLIFTGITMEHAPLNDEKLLLYRVHFLLGVTVFMLTILRVVALLKDPRPTPLYAKTSIREKFRNGVYSGFYIAITWMCISGILSLSLEGIVPALQSGQLADLPDISADGFHPIMLSHHLMAKIVFLLLIFHIGGFLIHLIEKKELTLSRIWFSRNN